MTTQKQAGDDAEELKLLRAEVARLKDALDRASIESNPTDGSRGPAIVWRAICATALLLVGILLAPVTIAAAWVATEISDTDRFVASLAPLSHDPEVRNYVGTAIVGAIEKHVDIDGLTKDAFSGIADLGLPPRAATALEALSPAAAQGLKGLLSAAVHRVITSPQFQKAWDKTLRLSHDQLDDILTNNQNSAIVVGDNGTVGIRLAPILAQVKSQLQAANFPLADQIPTVNTTIAVGTVKEIVPLRNAYQLLLLLVGILPWIAIVCIAAGILVAPGRARAAMWSGIGLAVCVLLGLAALAVERQIVASRAAIRGVPQGVTFTLLDALTAQIWAAGLGVVLIGVVLACAGFFAGSSRAAISIRSASGRAVSRLQHFLQAHRLWSPGVGSALRSARYGVWIVAIGGALVALYLSAPLTVGAVIVATVVAAGVLLVFSLFQSHPNPPAAGDSGRTGVSA